jgi:hypothetical protein
LLSRLGEELFGPIYWPCQPSDRNSRTKTFGGASALLDTPVGPKAGAGPWVTKFWFTWTCANAAVGSANAAAMANQRNGPNVIRPPAAQDLTPPRLQCAAKRIEKL